MRREHVAMLMMLTLAAPSVAWQSPTAEPRQREPAPSPAPGEKAASAPVERFSAADQQRIADWVTLIEGQNTPQARTTGAREILRLGSVEAAKRLVTILSGSNRPARIAVAAALAECPAIDASFLPPLLTLLGDDDSDTRQAAAVALAKGGSPAISRISDLLNDSQAAQTAKLAAIDGLGRMTQRDAIALLMSALADPASPLCKAALTALERATAQEFQGDLAAAQRWWEENRGGDASGWQQIQIDRLVRQSGLLAQRLHEAELRLSSVLRDNFFRAGEPDRAALLLSFLADPSEVVRLLGIDLIQSQITEGKTPTAEMVAKLRELYTALEPRVRAAAVRTAASLRDRADAERFQQRLATETNGTVRQALIYGLGYVGGPEVVPTLLASLSDSDRTAADEAITALGRVAEKPGVDTATRELIGSTLLERWGNTASQPTNNRERLLRAMSRVPDRRFTPIFIDALAPTEPAAQRLAAVRGVALLADPRSGELVTSTQALGTNGDANATDSVRKQLVEALLKAVADGDVAVRKAAVESLCGWASSDAHLLSLWGRLIPTAEPDESVRTTAWRGVLRVLATRPASEIETWIERLPDNGPGKAQRALELLQLAEKQCVAANAPRADLGRIRARIAAQRIALNQPVEALATYCAALDDLSTAHSPDASKLALDLIRYALLNDKYEGVTATTLASDKLAIDGEPVWAELRSDIEALLRRESVDRAVACTGALCANPPGCLSASARQELDRFGRRARDLRAEMDDETIAAAVLALRANPADESARAAIAHLGPRAARGLRTALQSAISADPAAPAVERVLYDLLRAAVPDWPGFAPDASIADKLKSLERINA